VSALLDIQEGRVGREYLKKVDWNPRVTLITLDKGGKGDARNPGCVRSKPDGRRDMPDPQSIS
jgi:hypothetical protein